MQSTDVNRSILEWIKQIKKEQGQIKYLGDKVIEELKNGARDGDHLAEPLNGLKNIWCTGFSTKQGFFLINIIQTAFQ